MEAFTAVDFLEDVNIVAETVTALAPMKRASNVYNSNYHLITFRLLGGRNANLNLSGGKDLSGGENDDPFSFYSNVHHTEIKIGKIS